MTETVAASPNQACYLRLRTQHLYPRVLQASGSVAELVKDLCSLQAQDAFAAVLAVWVRSNDLVADQVEQARVQERSIVRTWCMRGTLHLLATEDLGWLLPLFGPLVEPVARAVVAAGADGLIVEVHPQPEGAVGDGAQSLKPARFAALMQNLRPVAEAVGRSL
jgi:hypothetical protein